MKSIVVFVALLYLFTGDAVHIVCHIAFSNRNVVAIKGGGALILAFHGGEGGPNFSQQNGAAFFVSYIASPNTLTKTGAM